MVPRAALFKSTACSTALALGCGAPVDCCYTVEVELLQDVRRLDSTALSGCFTCSMLEIHHDLLS